MNIIFLFNNISMNINLLCQKNHGKNTHVSIVES